MPGLTLGDTIPDLEVETTHGKHRFYDYIGDGWLILFSHPGDFTPVCTTELGKMAAYADKFAERGVKLLGLSCDDLQSHREWIKDIEAYNNGDKVEFPIVADPKRELIQQLNMVDPDEKDPQGNQVPSRPLHIVGPDKKRWRNMDEVDQVVRVLDALHKSAKHKVATPANWKPGDPVVISPNVSNEEAKQMFPQDTIELVRQFSEPPPASKSLHFPTHFPQNSWEQFLACLWKQHVSYWRSPEYNLVRFTFMIVASVLFGAVFWQKGQNINNEQDLMSILGSMYIAVIFLGINNCSTVQPYVATERAVLYREKFAGMYSPWAYSFAQVTIEVPYTLFQAILYVVLTYPSVGYYWSAYKVFWYFYTTFCTFLYFVYLGMLIVSLSSNVQVASILASAVYTILNLFSGFLMPGPKIPKWWVWCYWICPTSWSLNGLLTSQYGDESKKILIVGEPKTISSFIEEFYGFQHDRLGLVAVVLLAFPIIYASLFAYCITKLNFQSR